MHVIFVQGYKEMPVEDRCILFTNCFASIELLDECNRSEPLVYGLPLADYETALRFFPEFDVSARDYYFLFMLIPA